MRMRQFKHLNLNKYEFKEDDISVESNDFSVDHYVKCRLQSLESTQ